MANPKENLTVQQLESELKTVVDWFQLGIQLGISPSVLKAIRNDRRDTGDCRLEMFMKWKDVERPTWQKVCKGLRAIGLRRLADEIEEKYYGPNYDAQDTEPEPPQPDYSRLPKVKKYLHTIPMKAQFDVGLVLGLSYTRLRKLKEQQPTEFLNEMIAAWLREEDDVKSTSWETLVAALKDDMVGQSGIASSIESTENLSGGT